jgi:predicted ATPase/DNA-binding XRE family transcriptional regulator
VTPVLGIRRNSWDAKRIAALREERGWTQEELAERSGLSVRTIRNLELGWVQTPRRSSVDLLADALGVADEHDEAGTDRIRWRGPQPPLAAVVGPRAEHDRLVQMVRSNRLTTFFGPGGVGKTRLALSIAAEVGQSFRDGVVVVELGDLPPERCGNQASAVRHRVRQQLGRDRADERAANLLLVLDNAEHIPDSVTAVTKELLGTCPGVQVLTTARRRLTERLGVNREIRPLSVDVTDGAAPAVDLVLRHVGADTWSAAELPLVAELCRRLGGLPRWLEFAAERLRTIPVALLLAHGPTTQMLWTNDHALLPHQRSLADSLRWDMDLLAEDHRTLLRGLAMLPTQRFTVDDVVPMPVSNPLTLLSDLLEASLIVADAGDRYRYRLAPYVDEVARDLTAEVDLPVGF